MNVTLSLNKQEIGLIDAASSAKLYFLPPLSVRKVNQDIISVSSDSGALLTMTANQHNMLDTNSTLYGDHMQINRLCVYRSRYEVVATQVSSVEYTSHQALVVCPLPDFTTSKVARRNQQDIGWVSLKVVITPLQEATLIDQWVFESQSSV